MNIQEEILKQLGGTKFKAMTGANTFIAGNNSLQFKIPLSNGINSVVIELNSNDTYIIKFYKIIKFDFKLIKSFTDVYGEDLKKVFENTTKLFTTL